MWPISLGFTKSNELFVGRMAMLGFAASLLGDVALTTVGGTDARTGNTFLAGENIYGPFEAASAHSRTTSSPRSAATRARWDTLRAASTRARLS